MQALAVRKCLQWVGGKGPWPQGLEMGPGGKKVAVRARAGSHRLMTLSDLQEFCRPLSPCALWHCTQPQQAAECCLPHRPPGSHVVSLPNSEGSSDENIPHNKRGGTLPPAKPPRMGDVPVATFKSTQAICHLDV